MAAVDDYLEIRPEATGRVRQLASSGRLTVGPWYVLMDEFLVSGETIVRNLEMGMARAANFGGAMDVGYLPDMFGHIAQMPQILAEAGFSHAVVWRGVPSQVDRDALLVGGPRRLQGAGRVPDHRLLERGHPPRRRGRPGPADCRIREGGGRLPARRHPVHERLGPPCAPTPSRPADRRGQRAARRLRLFHHLATPVPRTRPGGRIAHLAGRASLGVPGQPPHGCHLQPGRRQAGRRTGRGGPRAAGRALRGPVRRAGRLAGTPARAGLAERGAQCGPRLDLRVLGRRRGRLGARALRRVPPGRRRSGRARAGVAGPLDGQTRTGGRQPVGAHPVGDRRTGRHGRAR